MLLCGCMAVYTSLNSRLLGSAGRKRKKKERRKNRMGILLDPVTKKNEKLSERFLNVKEMECFPSPSLPET